MGHRARALAVLLLVLFAPAFVTAQDRAKPIITVLDFRTDGVSEQEMRSLVSLLSSALFRTGKFRVIDVTQRDLLLSEVEFSVSDCTDEACQLEIGKMLSAEMIVVGNIGKVGTRYLISAKLLDTETADTMSVADGVYATLDALVDDVPDLAAKLAGASGSATSTGTAEGPQKAGASPRAVNWRVLGAVASAVSGLGVGGLGGYLVWDGAVNGKTAIDAARAAYEQASESDAAARWDDLDSTIRDAKTRIYGGIGLAVGGVACVGLSVLLAVRGKPSAVPEVAVSLGVRPGVRAATLRLSIRL